MALPYHNYFIYKEEIGHSGYLKKYKNLSNVYKSNSELLQTKKDLKYILF